MFEIQQPQGYDVFYRDDAIKSFRKLGEGTTYSYITQGTMAVNPSCYFDFYKDYVHWKTWDDNVEELNLLESKNENVDFLYWCVKYPFPLTSRDYVYRRFAKYYESHNMWVIMSQVVDHPGHKANDKRVHVTKYKMTQAFRETPSGHTELVMKNYDDPQLSLPSWLTSWVTKTALPKFMNKLVLECNKYTDKKKNN
eukprot:TRINITY_DN624_c0_g1_i3.p1 TRINITY_DN624_c0_g1~~TRINITY_DN624_c0_g1_i3.p1  ORF type:complete len:210 (-),score=23.23 TRINITY_DN624_c0_g1_i3:191-778(-)